MKFKELANMDDAALDKKISEIETDLMKLRSEVASGTSPKNPKQIMVLKRTIAKINTLKKMREAQEQKQ